jgi:hypothetical protein
MASYISAAMIKSNIGIPGKDPRSWRGKRRKPKPAQAVPIIEGVRSPAAVADGTGFPRLARRLY